MEQMSLMMALSVVWEAFGLLIPLVALVALVDLALFVLAVRRRPAGWRRSVPISLGLGLLAFLAALIALPGVTAAGFADLSGLLDYGILAAVSLGLGLGLAALALPPLHWLLGRRA